MRFRIFLLSFFYGLGGSLFSQSEIISGQMYSADVNLGYNLARIETNYLFEEKMPYSFQLNWQKNNWDTSEQLGIFGYSSFGTTFLYHDFRDDELGKNFGLYAFMEYELIKPVHSFRLSFRLSQGIAYNTNPYDKTTNSKNKLFGSHWLFPFDIALYLKYPDLFGHWGLQVGWAVFHYSNGNLQSPNYGANIPSLTLGLNYNLSGKPVNVEKHFPSISKAWQYVSFLRFGINESDYYDSGQFPFFIPGFQVEKHLNFRHKINFGIELFLSYFLREQIRYEYYSVPEYHLDKIYDFKRIGIFAEHEFYYQKIGINIGAGYYVYYPYAFETRFYNRLGTKFYINKHWTLLYSLKVHDFNRAEAMEFGLMFKIK